MPRPAKPYPPVVTPREQWVLNWIVAIQARSDLRGGKFLNTIANQQFREHGERPADEVAAEWLAQRPGSR